MYLFDQDNKEKDYLNQTIFFEKTSVCTAQADKEAPPCDFSGALQPSTLWSHRHNLDIEKRL